MFVGFMASDVNGSTHLRAEVIQPRSTGNFKVEQFSDIAHLVFISSVLLQSQRDCVTQPRVARSATLGEGRKSTNNPEGVAAIAPHDLKINPHSPQPLWG
jgi:hypothetical protein